MFTIHLKNLKFFSFHGIHDEEKILGNDFVVDVDIKINPPDNIDSLHQTINYADVYELVKKRMAIPTPLIEKVAKEMADEIHHMDNRVHSIQISVFKLHPPIAGIEGSVGVTWFKEY